MSSTAQLRVVSPLRAFQLALAVAGECVCSGKIHPDAAPADRRSRPCPAAAAASFTRRAPPCVQSCRPLRRRVTVRPASASTLAVSHAAHEFESGQRRVELIVSDVDGTLLNPQQQLTPGTQQALQAAAEAGVPLVVATGKALGPWRDAVLPRIGSRLPGVSAWDARAAG